MIAPHTNCSLEQIVTWALHNDMFQLLFFAPVLVSGPDDGWIIREDVPVTPDSLDVVVRNKSADVEWFIVHKSSRSWRTSARGCGSSGAAVVDGQGH